MSDTADVEGREINESEAFDNYFDEFAGDGEQSNDSDAKLQGDINDKPDKIDGNHDDPVNDLEELKRQLSSIAKERDDLQHSFKSQVGRVSALQRKIDDLMATGNNTASSQDAVETPNPSVKDREIQQLLDDYPEIAGPILKAVEKKYGDLSGEIDKRLAPIVQDQQQRYIESQVSIMDSQIPNWRDTVNSEEYANWLLEQPDPVRGMAESIHANDYIWLMKQFNSQRKNNPANDDVGQKALEIVERRQQKLASNVAVKSTGQSNKSTPPDDFDSAWNYYAARK
jgi:hypothetical protein